MSTVSEEIFFDSSFWQHYPFHIDTVSKSKASTIKQSNFSTYRYVFYPTQAHKVNGIHKKREAKKKKKKGKVGEQGIWPVSVSLRSDSQDSLLLHKASAISKDRPDCRDL